MRKKELDPHLLATKIKELQAKYPPNGKTNIDGAFYDLSDEFPNTIPYYPFVKAYHNHEDPKKIIDAILKESQVKRNNIKNLKEPGRKRSSEWQLGIDVETILYFPHDILKRFKPDLNIEREGKKSLRIQFFGFLKQTIDELRQDPESEDRLPEELKRPVHWTIERMLDLYEVCDKRIIRNNPEHTKMVLLQIWAALHMEIPVKMRQEYLSSIRKQVFSEEKKGKKVSTDSIFRQIAEAHTYAYGLKEVSANPKLYSNKKLYWMLNLLYFVDTFFFNILDWDNGLIVQFLKYHLSIIKPILNSLPFETQNELIESLYPPAITEETLRSLTTSEKN